MPSSFSWLAHSESERQKALDVIDLFRERDTRDELGIGQIRDALSDLLFPGVTTIQTRAGYFLFIPWIYLYLEARRVPSKSIAARARAEEVRLIDALASSEDPAGTIGIEARDALKRLPSLVYWGGLGVWKIRLFPYSCDQYHRSRDAFYGHVERWKREGLEVAEGRQPRSWHPGLPDPPGDFPARASFRLRYEDAVYLQERTLITVPDTLLAFLVGAGQPLNRVEFPWDLPVDTLPAKFRTQLSHARNLSAVIHGAALLYNLMLAEKAEKHDWVEGYRGEMAAWAKRLERRKAELASWDRGDFWATVDSSSLGIRVPARRFVDAWFKLALDGKGSHRLVDDPGARLLIENRELRLKGPRARLRSQRALELWSGAAGIARLDYRWRVVRDIVRDIVTGLEAREVRAGSA